MLFYFSKGGIYVLNQAVLVGRLVQEPELNKTEKGNVTNITLAVPRSYKNSDGEYDTDFIRCTLWQAIAENTVEYCKKGDLVGIKGRIQSSNYEDKDGNKRYAVEIIVDKVTFLASKKQQEAE